jgi:hypothetical protein
MTDTTTMVDTTDADSKKKGVAIHHMIAGSGAEHGSIDSALGVRYTDRASKETFEYLIPVPEKAAAKGVTPDDLKGSALMMLALFGAKTKATNETSRVRQKGGNNEAEMEALDEVFGSITKGVWREQAEGGGGSRVDKSLLATVLLEMLGEGAKGDHAYYVTRLTDDEDYRKLVMKSDAGIEYRNRSGRKGPAVATLA